MRSLKFVNTRKIVFQTRVNQTLSLVKERFNEDLFRFLAPMFPKVSILRYDGQEPGNQVWVELNFILFSWQWQSLISESRENPDLVEFTDVGTSLPPFLSSWKHIHRIENIDNQTLISDIIFWEPGKYWPGWLVHILLIGQFSSRPRLYRKWFQK